MLIRVLEYDALMHDDGQVRAVVRVSAVERMRSRVKPPPIVP
ncbi:hypothetical protein [Gordonia sp. OPL2]|nr:hypothetical protein [Gordonia sp. OPL2]